MRSSAKCATVASVVLLTGCASQSSVLNAEAGQGSIRLFTGETVPVSSIVPNHPALAVAMPSHQLLWKAGLKFPEIHCHFVGDTGKLDRVTLSGVMDAAAMGLVTGVFGGEIPKTDIETAYRNLDRQVQVFANYVWKKSGGDRSRIRQLMKASIDQDARCLGERLKAFQTQADLLRQGLHFSRDEEGRPLVVTQLPQNVEKYAQAFRFAIENHQTVVSGVLWLYQKADEQLTLKLAEAAGRATVAAPPIKPRPQKTALIAKTPGLDVDLTPINAVHDATAAAIATLKAHCLRKAAIECAG